MEYEENVIKYTYKELLLYMIFITLTNLSKNVNVHLLKVNLQRGMF